MKFLSLALLLIGATLYNPLHAQTNQAKVFSKESGYPQVLELNWLNEQFLIKQRQRVNEITRKNFGQQLKQGKSNIPLLQRIIDESLIPQKNTLELQALGVILGDIYADSHKKLSWQVYEDELGKSHAICVNGTQHCLFPVTMLSRRIEAGINPNVNRIYYKGIDAIKEHLPKLPYSN